MRFSFHHIKTGRRPVVKSKRKSFFAIRANKKITGVAVSTMMLALVAGGGYALFGRSSDAEARDYNAEIKALESQIGKYQERSEELSKQADTLSGKIAQLQNEQSEIQAQIDLSESKKNQLQTQIDETQQRIKNQAEALAKVLKNYYYSNQTTTLDILMNSNSVSDYIDRQSRQKSMTSQISKTVEDVREAKKELEKKKAEVEVVIKRQSAQKQDLANTQAEQQKLLEETNGLEDKYKELIGQKREQISQVQRDLEAAIRSWSAKNASKQIAIASRSCGGGYPFCAVKPDTKQSYGGFVAEGNARECVNYVQWRIYQLTGRNEIHGPVAADWRTVANSTPKANTAAIMSYDQVSGTGHIAWVEEVGTGSYAGMVRISEYNWSPAYGYSERWVAISSFTGGFYDPLKYHN